MTQRFSVVIPLYNKRPYVRRAVDSVLAQTHREFELIVVDDGSTDGGQEGLASIDDDRFRLVRQANAGEGAARNRGVAEAHEDWVAFLDADDLWLPGHLAETAEVIAAFPNAGFVATGFREVADVGVAKAVRGARSNIRRVDYFLEASWRIGRVNASNASVRRDALLAIDGFGAYKVGADLDCWARLALRRSSALSDRVTSIYVRGTGGAMEQLSAEPADIRASAVAARLEDISPSVASLCHAIAADPTLARRRGVHAYLNARVFGCVFGSLRRFDVVAAADYAKLLMPPYALKIAAVRILLTLPRGWLIAALRLARQGRDAIRDFAEKRRRAA